MPSPVAFHSVLGALVESVAMVRPASHEQLLPLQERTVTGALRALVFETEAESLRRFLLLTED